MVWTNSSLSRNYQPGVFGVTGMPAADPRVDLRVCLGFTISSELRSASSVQLASLEEIWNKKVDLLLFIIEIKMNWYYSYTVETVWFISLYNFNSCLFQLFFSFMNGESYAEYPSKFNHSHNCSNKTSFTVLAAGG